MIANKAGGEPFNGKILELPISRIQAVALNIENMSPGRWVFSILRISP